MSSLTEEQRKRIEDNKRKALAKRAQKRSPETGNDTTRQRIEENRQKALALRTCKQSPQKIDKFNESGSSVKTQNIVRGTSSNEVTSKVQSSSTQGLINKPSNNVSGPTSNRISNNTKNTWNNAKDSGTFYKSVTRPVTKDAESHIEKIADSVATVGPSQSSLGGGATAKCLLISRERFEVTCGYYPPLIDLFKTMTTKKYGMSSSLEYMHRITIRWICFTDALWLSNMTYNHVKESE